MRVLVQLVAFFVCFHEIAVAQTQNTVVRVYVRAEDEPVATR